MIEIVMLVALGFLLGCLLALMLARPFFHRAARLTRRRIEASMPMTISEIRADKDELRAQFAIKVQRLEKMACTAKDKAVRQLVEANKRRAKINALERECAALKRRLREADSRNAVLQETVERRLPDLEGRLARTDDEIGAREAELDAFKLDYAEQTRSLSAIREEVKRRQEEVERLRLALQTVPGSRHADDPRHLQAELSRLREELQRRKQIESQETADLLDHMQRLSEQIMEVSSASRSADIMQLPKPARDSNILAAEAKAASQPEPSRPRRARALRRAGEKRTLAERLGMVPADAD